MTISAAERARLTTRAAIASSVMAAGLVVLKVWAALNTGSVAMLGSLADTALDLLASLSSRELHHRPDRSGAPLPADQLAERIDAAVAAFYPARP